MCNLFFYCFLLIFGGSATAGSTEAFTEKLTAAGWTMNPIRGSTMQVGDIYEGDTQVPLVFGSQCFRAQPREGHFEEAEIVQALKGGISLPLGIKNIQSAGRRIVQQRFLSPYVSELAEIDLVPNQRCVSFLNEQREGAYVVTAVLMAEFFEKECTEVGGAIGGRFRLSVNMNQECVQKSKGHVVVAYKSLLASNVFKTNVEPVQEIVKNNDPCNFEQVYVERNLMVINGEAFNLRKEDAEEAMLSLLKKCEMDLSIGKYHRWRIRRRSTIAWTASLVGTIYVAPWMGVASINARKELESSLNDSSTKE